MQLKSLIPLLLLGWFLTSCSTFSIPNHGGGKRFLYEQKLLTTASSQALNDWAEGLSEDTLKEFEGGYVNLVVLSMGDEGGGLDGSDGALNFGGLFTGAYNGKNQQTSPQPVVSSSGSPTDGASYAVTNARDLEWLKGSVVRKLAEKGIITQYTPQAKAGEGTRFDRRGKYIGDLYVLFPEFGVSKLGANWFIFKMSTLSASVACEAFYLPSDNETIEESAYVPLGNGEGSAAYRTAFFLGMGPIAGGRFGSKQGTVGPSPFID
ncbi:MAG: hypothetical protein ACYS26_05570 [Planctomycetota bacterium]|jgi:hypothetical protein